MNVIKKLKENPKWHYSFSISATWAGAGSLIVGMSMVQNFGVVPFLLWALGNVLACIVFGLFANKFPYLRKVFTSKVAKIVIGIMCIFQLWVNMSGVNDSLSVINPTVATIVTYIVSVGFLVLYLKNALLKNVFTDDWSWRIVYGLIFVLCIVAIIMNGINVPVSGLADAEGMKSGFTKCITLIPGAFFYPYFWELFDYNDKNDDGTYKVDMKKCFVWGGLLFGLYLCFVFVLGMTSFNPVLNVIKGILLAIIAGSSLTSFIHSIYITFGKKVGLVVNTFGFIGWYFLIPLGVMNIWTYMQNTRFYLVIIGLIASLIWKAIDKKKVDKH